MNRKQMDEPTDAMNGKAPMPVLFIGHGSPTNAIEDNEFSQAWAETAKAIAKPKAIICVSAHWETAGTRVTAMERPRTIHDFYGFPRELFEMDYPVPGDPVLARLVRQTVRKTEVGLDLDRGLDHGVWSVLSRMYPEADIPVIQLSLDNTKGPEFHYELGKELKTFRERGILIIGSGNIVHNLRQMVWDATAYDWAVEFDMMMKEFILSRDHDEIIDYPKLGRAAQLSVPTNEHFLPLLYVLSLQDEGDGIKFFTETVTLGSVSMRSLMLG